MSMEYCHYCDAMIDTDYNAEHFINNETNNKIVSCVAKEQDDEEITNEGKLRPSMGGYVRS